MSQQIPDDVLKLGPETCSGEEWFYNEKTDIKEIVLCYMPGFIFHISFVYGGPLGDVIRGGGIYNTIHELSHIRFAPDEFLTRIHGYNHVKDDRHIRILSLAIETNKKSYGPFGDGYDSNLDTAPYSYDIGQNRFRGFCGWTFQDTIAGLGVLVKKYISISPHINQISTQIPEIPDGVLKLGPETCSGEEWFAYEKTDIKEISVSYNPAFIYNISVVYAGPNGDIIIEAGEVNPSANHWHIRFASDEFLTRIHGSNQVFQSNACHGRMLSLAIETNKKSYGPFGEGFVLPDPKKLKVEPYSYDIGQNRFKGFHGWTDRGVVVGFGVYVKKYISNSANIQITTDPPTFK